MTPRVRNFPRYKVNKYTLRVVVYSNSTKTDFLNETIFGAVILDNVSLGGACLILEKKIDLRKYEHFEINFARRKISFNGSLVWENIDKSGSIYCGIKLRFDNLSDYEHWMKFIIAVDAFDHKNSANSSQVNKLNSTTN